MKKIFITLLISICFSCYLKAQNDSTGISKIKVKLSANYNSNLNYYGRTDSLNSSGFFPMAELWLDKHFYINAAPVFVHNIVTSFDYAGTITTIGHQFITDEKKWFGNAYLLKPFYKNNSQLVQSALKAQVAFNLTSLNKILNITGGVDVKLSEKTDFGITAGLDHLFRQQFRDNSVIVIDPSAYVFAGTQQFSRSYYKQNNMLLLPAGQRVSESVTGFNILSYEFSIPIIYAKEKLQLSFIPTYVIPQNLITVEGRPDLSERGKEMFYATVAVKLIL